MLLKVSGNAYTISTFTFVLAPPNWFNVFHVVIQLGSFKQFRTNFSHALTQPVWRWKMNAFLVFISSWKLGCGGFNVLFFGSYIKKLTNTWLLRVFIGVEDLMPFPTISHLNNERDRKFPGSQHLLPCHQSLTLVSSTVSPQNNGGVFLVSLYLFVCLYLEIHHTKPSYISIAIYSFHLNHRPATRNEIWCLP